MQKLKSYKKAPISFQNFSAIKSNRTTNKNLNDYQKLRRRKFRRQKFRRRKFRRQKFRRRKFRRQKFRRRKLRSIKRCILSKLLGIV